MGNQNESERQHLSIKALDMLMWRFIRVCNFEDNEGLFYKQIHDQVLEAAEGFSLSDGEQVDFIHYVLALLAVQIGHQEQPMPSLAELRKRVSKYNQSNVVAYAPDDPDLFFAMAVLLYWAGGDLSEELIINIYETFETVFKQCVQGRKVPVSAKVDFIASVLLVGDFLKPLGLLVHLLHAEKPAPFINVPRKRSKQFELNGVSLVYLQRIKEFNSLARIIFGINLEYRQQTITYGNEMLPRDQYLVVPKQLFKNPATQKVLIDIINQTGRSFDRFAFNESAVKGDISAEFLEGLLRFCVEDYELKVFAHAEGKPLRIERVINYLTGYYISYFKKHQSVNADLYSEYVFQKNDANKRGESEPLPSICSFLSRALEEMGVLVTPKKLDQSQRDFEGRKEQVEKSWDAFKKHFSDPGYTWAQLQIEADYLSVEPVNHSEKGVGRKV